MNTRIISIEPTKRGMSEVRFETPAGDIYVAGICSLFPCKVPEYYTRAIVGIVDKWSTMQDVELFSFLSQKLLQNGLESLFYLQKDAGEERVRIGKRIKELREAKGMEAKKLAELANIDAANLCRIEQGKYSAGFDILCKIANALGYKVDFVEP